MNEKELRYHRAYLNMSIEWSKLSHCKRKQVGALIVKNDMIISDGYNGAPAGMDNNCEDCDGKTHWYVLHAEENAILKCSKNGTSCDGATMYITHSACRNCARQILQSGIKRLIYINDYKDLSGLEFLANNGVEVIKIKLD